MKSICHMLHKWFAQTLRQFFYLSISTYSTINNAWSERITLCVFFAESSLMITSRAKAWFRPYFSHTCKYDMQIKLNFMAYYVSAFFLWLHKSFQVQVNIDNSYGHANCLWIACFWAYIIRLSWGEALGSRGFLRPRPRSRTLGVYLKKLFSHCLVMVRMWRSHRVWTILVV